MGASLASSAMTMSPLAVWMVAVYDFAVSTVMIGALLQVCFERSQVACVAAGEDFGLGGAPGPRGCCGGNTAARPANAITKRVGAPGEVFIAAIGPDGCARRRGGRATRPPGR